MTVRECVRRIYERKGVIGFYKGITASYFGISETVIHFVIYEAIKSKLVSHLFKIISNGKMLNITIYFLD